MGQNFLLILAIIWAALIAGFVPEAIGRYTGKHVPYARLLGSGPGQPLSHGYQNSEKYSRCSQSLTSALNRSSSARFSLNQ